SPSSYLLPPFSFFISTRRPPSPTLFPLHDALPIWLLGSEYFCAHPTVPAGRIAANLNIDGINIWGRTRDVTCIGLGKSTLDQVRSEEHTSELQSLTNLVCRLLLEKKNK